MLNTEIKNIMIKQFIECSIEFFFVNLEIYQFKNKKSYLVILQVDKYKEKLQWQTLKPVLISFYKISVYFIF